MFTFFVLEEGREQASFFFGKEWGEGFSAGLIFILGEEWDKKCVGSCSQFFPPGEVKHRSGLAVFDIFLHLGKYVNKNKLAAGVFFLHGEEWKEKYVAKSLLFSA